MRDEFLLTGPAADAKGVIGLRLPNKDVLSRELPLSGKEIRFRIVAACHECQARVLHVRDHAVYNEIPPRA